MGYLILTGLLVLFFVQAMRDAYRPGSNDFGSYLRSADALIHRESPYQTDSPFPYIYPLFLATVLVPLTVLPVWLSHSIWFLLNVTALAASLFIFSMPFRRNGTLPGWKDTIVPLAALILVHFGVVQDHLFNGQVNCLVLLGCALFFHYEQAGRNWPAALSLAAAAAIKLTPVIFLPYLLIRRRYQLFLLTLLLFSLYCALPVVLFGKSILTEYVRYITEIMPRTVAGSWTNGDYYFTLQAFVRAAVPSLASVPNIIQIIMLLTAGGVVLVDWLLRRGRAAADSVWAVHLYLIGSLLVGPKSESHHLVIILPVVFLGLLVLLYRNALTTPLSLLLVGYWPLHLLARAFKGPFYVFSLLSLLLVVFVMVQRAGGKPLPLRPGGP